MSLIEKSILVTRKYLQENPIYNELYRRYSHTDTKVQRFIIFSISALFICIFLSLPTFLFIKTYKQKIEIQQLQASSEYLSEINNKIKEHSSKKQTSPQVSISKNASLSEIIQKSLSYGNIPEENYEIIVENTDNLTVKMSQISIRQLFRSLYFFKISSADVNIALMNLETRGDKKGYIWSMLKVKK